MFEVTRILPAEVDLGASDASKGKIVFGSGERKMRVLVNLDCVCWISGDEEGTVIFMLNGPEIYVSESYETVKDLCA
jgi:hypothetical protein